MKRLFVIILFFIGIYFIWNYEIIVKEDYSETLNLPSASDTYVKLEGWKTVTNEEYGFSVDVPGDIDDRDIETESTLVLGRPYGLSISSYLPDSIDLKYYVIFGIDESILVLNPLSSPNITYVKEGGDAFKYFYQAYTYADSSVDDLFHHISTSDGKFATAVSVTDRTGENKATIKTIIRSFKKL